MNGLGDASSARVDTIRTFIAIPVTQEVTRALIGVQRGIQSRGSDSSIRWCGPEQFHLTLAFLGELERSRLEGLRSVLNRVCDGVPRFRLTLTTSGCFPGERRPRVIWVGVSGDIAVLQRLERKVANATEQFRSARIESPFHPHLTIGRIPAHRRVSVKLSNALKEPFRAESCNWQVSEVELMTSTLSSAGAKYECLAVCHLGSS